MPAIKSFTTISGTSLNATFTLGSNPAVGDLMVAILVLDTPLTVKAPLISTTNVQDQWTPVGGVQDTQVHDSPPGVRTYMWYKTANATDATTNVFTFTFSPFTDASGQAGVPQYPTSDFCGILSTWQTSSSGFTGFDTSALQSYQPNADMSVFPLPQMRTNGGADTFLSTLTITGSGGSVTHTDPAATAVAAAAMTTPTYRTEPFSISLWSTTYSANSANTSGNVYPFAFNVAGGSAGINRQVQSALVGLQDASNWYYNGPFVREGYPYEGPDQMLILRYPYHWAYTVLKTSGVITIGQFFSQDQLNAADVVYYQNQLIPEADRDAILTAGVGGDFRPSIQVPGPYINPWKYVPI